ncbi:hypothetical protein NGRA_0060 [Nosema granulosis]|uniref:CUE domain-containing protein n=1 Tax=Nosema granulosis TaxID=83296 RepID=A0A9P6L0D3_9MICR|nr:hypothetical protein NGRA_0060 [Nosema granulosis]
MVYVENKKFIKEMFPDVEDEVIERLLKSTGNNVDLVVTKIIDGSYKGIQFDLKDIYFTKMGQTSFKKELYFPELVNDLSSIKEEIDVSRNRKEIKRLNENINLLKSKNLKHKLRLSNEYYSEQIGEIKETINKLNKECTLSILKKSLKDPNCIDLHGLYCLDALKFVDDHIRTYSPTTFKLITGAEDSSMSLRPSLVKFLKEKDYSVSSEGPCIVAKKINKYK